MLGRELAVKLMEQFPPVGWAELATSRDLDQVEARLGVAVSDLRAEVHRDMATTTRTLVFAQFGAVATAVGLVFAAVRL